MNTMRRFDHDGGGSRRAVQHMLSIPTVSSNRRLTDIWLPIWRSTIRLLAKFVDNFRLRAPIAGLEATNW